MTLPTWLGNHPIPHLSKSTGTERGEATDSSQYSTRQTEALHGSVAGELYNVNNHWKVTWKDSKSDVLQIAVQGALLLVITRQDVITIKILGYHCLRLHH